MVKKKRCFQKETTFLETALFYIYSLVFPIIVDQAALQDDLSLVIGKLP